jgi:Na+/phosphate symporter
MTGEAKETLKVMYDECNAAAGHIAMLQTAFIYNSVTHLKDCTAMVNSIKTKEPELTRKAVELAKNHHELMPYISVPEHLLRIAENIEIISASIEEKIKSGILFSDRAVTETTFLLQRLIETLKPTADIILAKNVFLNRYVQESEAGISKNASLYATQHEERLIEGTCSSAASTIYLTMLDAIKNIAWHARGISSKLVEWTLPKA